MKDKKEFKLSYLAAHFTTIVSVTLVLLMIGIIAMATWSASRETRRLKEQLELSVVLGDTVSDDAAREIARRVAASPYAAASEVITADQAMQEWNEEEDQDLEEILGANPFSPEVAIALKASYASPDSIAAISARLSQWPGVEEVVVPDAQMVEDMNRNIASLSWILGGIALVMLVISFVLINNTVHLAIYARRFTIHTMQLVGATDAFIRRPFLIDNLLNGLVSGAAASAILAALILGIRSQGMADLTRSLDWTVWGVTAAGLVAIGTLICVCAAAIATRRYLHSDYDTLFRQ